MKLSTKEYIVCVGRLTKQKNFYFELILLIKYQLDQI